MSLKEELDSLIRSSFRIENSDDSLEEKLRLALDLIRDLAGIVAENLRP